MDLSPCDSRNAAYCRKLGQIKVSGTIDGYEFKNRNLAPVTDGDKMMSVNGTIRKAINKGGGDQVLVTIYKDSDNKLTTEDQVLECLSDADALKKFKSLEEHHQEKIFHTVLSEANEDGQENRILAYLKSYPKPKNYNQALFIEEVKKIFAALIFCCDLLDCLFQL